MPRRVKLRRRAGSALLVCGCAVVAGSIVWSFIGRGSDGIASSAVSGEPTGSIGQAGRASGPSGLPLPRFVSLKADKVNVRRGPSSDHPVAWVYQRRGLPVEIVAEFENWRRIRDSDGEEGWILQNLLSGRRTAVVAPWRREQTTDLLSETTASARIVARVAGGAVAEVKACDGTWCEIEAGGYDGYVEQAMLWGVYPGEKVD